MRRSLQALLPLALLAAALAGATAVGAQRSAASATIPCPGTPPSCCVPVVASPRVIPCCLPPVISCPGITIASSPEPSSARQSVTITGRVSSGAAVGMTVSLWQELPGQTSFHRVAQTSSDSTGIYTFTRSGVRTNRTWYVTALGGTLRSVSVLQQVRAIVSLSVSSRSAGSGERVTFKGKVTPSHGGERIRLQERTTSGWTVIAIGRLTARSSFSMSKPFAGTGMAMVRAAFGPDGRNIASYSPAVHARL